MLLSPLLLLVMLAAGLGGAHASAQDPGPEVVQGGAQPDYTPSIMLIATREVDNSIRRALSEFGYGYAYYFGGDWTGIDFSSYDIVILALDAGVISDASIAKIRTDVINQGKRVIIFGGCPTATFVNAVDQYLVSVDTSTYGWALGEDFYGGSDYLLELGLPMVHNLVDYRAAYYMLRVDDPDIVTIAYADQGMTEEALFFKNSDWPGGTAGTEGDLTWFIYTPYEGFWSNPQDYYLLKRILLNALGHQWLTTSSINWFRFDCVWFDDGTGPSAYNQKIYCMGGRNSSSTEVSWIYHFDPRSETWIYTGDNLIEDVSNYTALILEDENLSSRGPAIYVVGGYDSDNADATVDMVQRYYPRTGHVEHVSSDPWPVYVGGNLVTPGGCASVHNKIYCFGGWENAVAPYFSDETWEYDPNRPAGSRWQRVVTADLGQARAYIQVAVHDDIIYAMGGHYDFSFNDLSPSTMVEALDVNNLGVGWVPLPSMPVASAEGQGFSWGGNLYVVGGGDWPEETALAMEYSDARNVWNKFFPDLNTARRLHGGALVPLRTADPLDGMPGMWVFGGRIFGSDDPPYGWAEYLPLSIFEVYVPLIFRSY